MGRQGVLEGRKSFGAVGCVDVFAVSVPEAMLRKTPTLVLNTRLFVYYPTSYVVQFNVQSFSVQRPNTVSQEMAQLSLSPDDTTNNLSYPSANVLTLSTKFPHTRAQLSAIARQHKPTDNYDSDAENDDYNRVSSSQIGRAHV